MPAISTVHRRQPPKAESSLCEHSDGMGTPASSAARRTLTPSGTATAT